MPCQAVLPFNVQCLEQQHMMDGHGCTGFICLLRYTCGRVLLPSVKLPTTVARFSRGSNTQGLMVLLCARVYPPGPQGCWFFAITHIMYSNDTTWRASHPDDMTRVMFTPVLFTWIFIGR